MKTLMNQSRRFIKYSGNTKVATREDIIKAQEEQFKKKQIDLISFYNSELKLIVDDPTFMVMPIDERIINRAHGIFESMAIKDFQFISLDMHLQRLIQSAEKTGIKLPLKKDQIEEIMMDMAQFTYDKLSRRGMQYEELKNLNINLRIWVSSGRKDFGIYSCGKEPIFYCATFVNKSLNEKISTLYEGVKEYTVTDGQIKQLETAKTTSYLKNCVQSDISKSQGGYQGIRLNENGEILEQAMANVAYINKFSKEFVITPKELIVPGTTLKNVIENFVEPNLISQDEIISKVTERYFTPQEVLNEASEFISFGGDKVIPILQLDNVEINEGKKGDVCQKIQDWYKTIQVIQTEHPINITYEKACDEQEEDDEIIGQEK